MNKFLLGSHMSCSAPDYLLGAVRDAIAQGANTLMVYTGAPTSTMRSSVDKFKVEEALVLAHENNLDFSNFVCHAPYLINLANSSDPTKYEFSYKLLVSELKRAQQLHLTRFVLHPGSKLTMELEESLRGVARALNNALAETSDITILLETMAGKGNEVGCTLSQVKAIIDLVDNKDRIGVCLDSCHLFDAGIDISDFDKFLDYYQTFLPLSTIKCIHLNDSKNVFASHKDRHENIGKGMIGINTLVSIVSNSKLKDVPKILETPYIDGKPPYLDEIILLNKLVE